MDSEGDIHVFGVQHTDSSNTDMLLNGSDSPLQAIFHEAAEPNEENFGHFCVWAFVTPSTALRTILSYTGDATGRTECEQAAIALSKREKLEITYLGQPWLKRAKSVFPLHTLVWLPALYTLGSNTPLVIGMALTFLPIIVAGLATYPHKHRLRETRWVDQITQEVSRADSAVVVVGDDHLDRLSTRLSEQGYSVNPISLYEQSGS